MQQIFINPCGVGLTHLFATINYALNLSEKLYNLNINSKCFCDAPGWETFNEIFDLQHKNFSKDKLVTPKNAIDIRNVNEHTLHQLDLPIRITANSVNGLNKAEDFFKIYQLTRVCYDNLKSSYIKLNNGNYSTIHVRGSCMIRNKHQGNYADFLNTQHQRIREALCCIPKDNVVLFVSDNQDLLVDYVDNKHIFSTSIALELYNKGVIINENTKMHSPDKTYTQGVATSFEVCFSAVQDFFLMIHSKQLFADTRTSGYAQTATRFFNMIKNNNMQKILF